MVNSTIFSLSAIFLAGSPFSFATISQYKTISIEKCIYKQSLHNLFSININKGNLHISTTSFDQIIGSAVQITSETYIANKTVNTRYSTTIKYPNSVTFYRCMFRECHVYDELTNGGAIGFTGPNNRNISYSLTIKSCSFYSCQTIGGQGGAIYCYRILNVSIIRCCIFKCFTHLPSSDYHLGFGTAAYLWSILGGITNIVSTSFVECPDTLEGHLQTGPVLFVFSGGFDIKHSNFSENAVMSSAGIWIENKRTTRVFGNNFVNLIGQSALSVSDVLKKNLMISRLNFVNCSILKKEGELYGVVTANYAEFNLDESVFVMLDNEFLIMQNETYDWLVITFRFCTFDRSRDTLINQSMTDFVDCNFEVENSTTNSMSFFDSVECWSTYTSTYTETVEPVVTASPTSTTWYTPDDSKSNKKTKYMIIGICVGGVVVLAVVVVLVVKFVVCKRKWYLYDKSGTLDNKAMLD